MPLGLVGSAAFVSLVTWGGGVGLGGGDPADPSHL